MKTSKNKPGHYTFTITMTAWGETPKEAFREAVEYLASDPGETPEEYGFENEEDYAK